MNAEALRQSLEALNPADPLYATQVVDRVLDAAWDANASDVHFRPEAEGLELLWRLDGVLHPITVLPRRLSPNIVARLKVLAELLTYRIDIPQEGRIRRRATAAEMRLSTFPILHGEKAVVRIFAEPGRFLRLHDLGLPHEVESALSGLLAETSGAIVVSGPAGSGKTTTLYACLRELAARSEARRSLASLEDPIEAAIPGVAQGQVNLAAGLTLENGLKALLRQDPEVIAIGEIRDRGTAEVALQAALTGHLILTTFHAGSACEVIGRLFDMGIEPYAIRSGLLAIVSQRLARRLCDRCAITAARAEDRLGLPVARARLPQGCQQCRGTGYAGRIAIAELIRPAEADLGPAILDRADVRRLSEIAGRSGGAGLWDHACTSVEEGLTSPAEIRRILGMNPPLARRRLGSRTDGGAGESTISNPHP